MASRQLIHSCRLYEECLKALKIGIRDKAKVQLALKGKSPAGRDSSASAEVKRAMEIIFVQIENDCKLLRSIKVLKSLCVVSCRAVHDVGNRVGGNASGCRNVY